MKKVLSILLILLLSLSGCTSPKEPTESEINIVSQELNTVVVHAVHSYVYARLLTDKLISIDINSIPREDLYALVDETQKAWDATYKMAEVIPAVADKELTAVSMAEPLTSSKSLFSMGMVQTVYGANEASDWANKITSQYDAVKGGNKLKQLGEQLGVDAKTAFKQLTMAQNILHGEAANDEADLYQKWLDYATTTKTVCKTGLFIGGTIATAGGVSALAGGATLGQSAGIIVSGVDVIIDIGATSSSIILGENNKVYVEFDKMKNSFAPVSFVFGIAGFDSATAGENLAFIGDNLMDWFYENKIAGFKLNGNKVDKASAWQIDINEKTPEEIEKEIIAVGAQPPEFTEKTLDDLINEISVNIDEYVNALKSIFDQFPVEEDPTAQEETQTNAPEANNHSDVTAIVGKYSGVITSFSSDEEETDSSPEQLEFEMKLNGNDLIFDGGGDDEDTVVCTYDSTTGKAVYKASQTADSNTDDALFQFSDITLELTFDTQSNPITCTLFQTIQMDDVAFTVNGNFTKVQ